MRTRTSWREKLERDQTAKVVDIPPAMQKRFGPGTMLIPRPLDVDALMRRIPAGKVSTISRMRAALAKAAGADVACPLTTGIFMRIAAEAAEEDLLTGRQPITPYWRVVRDDGSMIGKYPGGAEPQADRLRAEGHALTEGKKPRVRMSDELVFNL